MMYCHPHTTCPVLERLKVQVPEGNDSSSSVSRFQIRRGKLTVLSSQHHEHSHLLSWKAVGSQDVPEHTVNALDFESLTLLNQILSSNDLQALRTFTENNNSSLGPTR